MCGIAGIAPSSDATPDINLIKQMKARLVHRGPDDSGEYVAPGVALGFCRLAIIDLSPSGHQPMSNDGGNVSIIFNGEIYNYKHLRAQLEQHGRRFRSRTDTEVILAAYEEYGTPFLEHLRGMFALAIWDAKARTLLLARDRLGKKPLVYSIQNGILYFSSEIDALLSVIPKPEINTDVLPLYFRTQCIPSPHTIYQGISKLPPGHSLEWKGGKATVSRYWSPRFSPKTHSSIDEAGEEFERIFREAIRLRLQSDVPLGIFLSGGFDSSIITALAAAESPTPVKTFSIGFQEQSHDELPLARLVADRYHTEHHEFTISPSVADMLPMLLRHCGEPFADSSIIATAAVAKETRQFVTVALNGDGGDENFAGYEKYDQLALLGRLDVLPRSLRSFAAQCARILSRYTTGNMRRKLPTASDLLSGNLATRYLDLFFVFRERELKELFSEDFFSTASLHSETLLQSRLDALDAGPKNNIDMITAFDLLYYLPECLLVKADISSMTYSLEARSPFLDQEVIQFTTSLPPEYKISGGEKKFLLRKRFGHLLPPELLRAPKHGFDLPVNSWLRGPLHSFLRERIFDHSIRSLSWLQPEAIERLEREHLSHQAHHGIRLWSLLCFAVWYQDVYKQR